MNPVDALRHHAERRPKSPAFFSGEATWTYERLAAEANRLASSFVRLGVGKGDRVALHMPNLPELVVAYYACFQTGAIAAPLNLRFKTAELTPILARLKPALYLGHAELYPWVAELDPSILASERRFVVGGETGAPRARRWRELVANGSGQFSLPAPDPHAAALLLGTSGTTGLPKLVTHTLSTLSAIADFTARLGVDGEQIGVEALPMVHGSGMCTFSGA